MERGAAERRAMASSFSFFFFPLFLFLYFLVMFPYENLEVYKKAFAANQKIYKLLKNNTSIPCYAKDQLGRASLSIMLNSAEGSAKFSDRDRRNFYVIARGSVFECAALINFLHNECELPDDIRQKMYNAYEEISRMLFTMIKNLEAK